jgi:hypothetical protein
MISHLCNYVKIAKVTWPILASKLAYYFVYEKAD